MKLTKEEQEKIKLAVQDLEKESSGELVLYLAKNSSTYNSGKWILAASLAGLTAVVIAVLGYLWLLPRDMTIVMTCSLIFSALVGGFLLGLISPRIRASLMGNSYVHKKVMAKAHAIFLEKEVFQTVDRTGILVFISLLEHRVVVLGDTGISAVVKADEWETVVNHIVAGIKDKSLCDGILEAVKDCKQLLLDNKFKVRPDDTNELPDEITIEV